MGNTKDSHDSSGWMAAIDDDVLLSALSIPGTHDSAAYPYSVPFIATQRMNIHDQLEAGIRYFDLRCGLRRDILEMVHGPTILGIPLESLLAVVYNWLVEHPSEAVIVQLKKDRTSEASSKTFSAAISEVITAHPERWLTTNLTPTLGQTRGKIQLLRRFRGTGISAYGINVSRWQDNPLKPFTMRCGHGIRVTVQDHYKYDEPIALPALILQKSDEVHSLIQRARQDTDVSHWYINYTSALEFNWSYRYAPSDVAEGSWYAFKRIQGVNTTVRELLKSDISSDRIGILAMDFPDNELIAAIVKTNFGIPARRVDGPTVLLICMISLYIGVHCWSVWYRMVEGCQHVFCGLPGQTV